MRSFLSRLIAFVATLALLLPGIAEARSFGGGTAQRPFTLGMSMILGGQLRPLGEGMARGAELAVAQRAAGIAGMGVALRFRALDDSVNGIYSGARDAQNARTFINDPTIFAEDGPYNSGAAAVSMPVYNRADLVQVSPGNTLPDLTQPRFRAKYEPATAAGTRGLTYFRVNTTDAFQGPAGASYAAHDLHVKTGFVVNDQGLPGIGLANAYLAALPGLGINVVGRGALTASPPKFGSAAVVAAIARLKPDPVFFGGDPETGGHAFADSLRQNGLHMPLIGGDALNVSSWIDDVHGVYHPGSQNSWFTAIGPNPLQDPRCRAFRAAYRARFHDDPTSFSALAYDAANMEIDALASALRAGYWAGTVSALRERVRANVAAAHYRGVGGAGSFDRNGDTTNKVISIWRVSGKTTKSFEWLGYSPGYAPHS